MNEKAREALNALCGLVGVKRIVFVDDRNAQTDDKFIDFFGFCIEFKSLGHDPSKEVAELENVDFGQEDDDLREELRRLWENLDQPTQDHLFDHLYDRTRPEEKTNQVAISVMNELCRDLEYLALSLAEWLAKKEILFEESKAVGSLFLFDEDLSKEEGGREDSGVDLLSEALAHTPALCGLISYKFTPEQERDRWASLETDERVDQNRCVPISKKHLQGDAMSFVRRIKFTAMMGPCLELQDAAAKAISASFATALEQIKTINIYDFEHIVFHASRAEGIWEPDTLFRLFGVFQRHAARDLVKNDHALDLLVTKIRQISQVEHIAPDVQALRHDSWRIQQRELYEDVEHLNRYHLQIEIGDIFQKSGGTQFILLAQPCDLMLREDRKGERRPDVTEVILVRITKEEPKHISEGYEKLPYFEAETGEPVYVDFRKTEVVKLCVLDLCVYQSDGSATLRLGSPAPEKLIPVWRMHYANLVKEYEKVVERYKTLLNALPKETHQQAHSIAQNIAVPPSSNQNLFKGKIVPSENRISYDVKRIGRLQYARAEALLARFAHYLSRAAFDVDFGKEV